MIAAILKAVGTSGLVLTGFGTAIGSAHAAPFAAEGVSAASPPGRTVLASRSSTGGLCPAGPCGSRLVIRTDGSWRATTTGATVDRGAGLLNKTHLRHLRAATAATRLASSAPFTGTFPTAYDGIEVTYGWRAGGGWRHVSSCERVIDPDDPLVAAILAIRADTR